MLFSLAPSNFPGTELGREGEQIGRNMRYRPPPHVGQLPSIEEGKAASKSPHKEFGYFLSILRGKQFLPISLKIQLLVVLCNI